MPMTTRDKWDTLSVEDIDGEVQERHSMIRQMVGTLYPSILCGEIDDLSVLKAELIEQREQTARDKAAFDEAKIDKPV